MCSSTARWKPRSPAGPKLSQRKCIGNTGSNAPRLPPDPPRSVFIYVHVSTYRETSAPTRLWRWGAPASGHRGQGALRGEPILLGAEGGTGHSPRETRPGQPTTAYPACSQISKYNTNRTTQTQAAEIHRVSKIYRRSQMRLYSQRSRSLVLGARELIKRPSPGKGALPHPAALRGLGAGPGSSLQRIAAGSFSHSIVSLQPQSPQKRIFC